MKFFNKRTLLLFSCVIAVIVISAFTAVLVYVSSPGFKETARQYVIHGIEAETGSRVSLGRVYWNLWTQRIWLLDLTARGVEPTDSAPLAHFESIEAGVNIRSLFKRRIDLFELTVTRPEFHLTVDSRGNTNLPSPPPRAETGLSDFQLSIENFKFAQGTAFINEHRVNLDFVLKNLNSDLSYQDATRIMTAHLSYDGILERDAQPSIPYSLTADLDYTHGTILTKHVVVSSGRSQVQLQGRINDVLTGKIAGTLEYTGSAEVSFMSYFYPKETFAGQTRLAGTFGFSKSSFFTRGVAKSDSITFTGWNLTSLRSDYEYRYPEKRLTLEHVSTHAFDGTSEGEISVDSFPGQSRVALHFAYKDIDGTSLANAFPWDPKYRIESRITGNLQGWFEGRFENFEINGNAALASSTQAPATGIVSLPLDGTLGFSLRPKHAIVANASLHFFSTSVQADGPVDTDNINLDVHLASSDLTNLQFIYPDANGVGSFDGVLSGPAKTPLALGAFDLQRYRYRNWTIEKVSGMARVDTLANIATLNGVRVVQGQSQIMVSGTAALDGGKVDLQIQTAQVHAEDVSPFVKEQFGGVFSGTIHMTSLNPLRFDGDVRAAGLAYKGQTLQEAQSHIQYDAPTVTLLNLAAADNGSTISGRATYNTTSEAMTFTLHINSIDLMRLRAFGMPEAVEGRIQQADLSGKGSPRHPEVDGNARLQNLAFHGETFPTARVDLKTTGSQIDLKLSEARNLDLAAQIDTAKDGYPFKAQVGFKQYSIERLAGFSRGTLTVSGDAALEGTLSDVAHVSGSGHINPVDIEIQGQMLHSTKAFAFDFNSERLRLADGVSLVSASGTQLSLTGTVGLTPGAKLDLLVTGEVDAGLLTSDVAWTIGGAVNLKGQVRGTLAKPDLQGQASFSDLSIARQGVSFSLTSLKGDVIFNEQRMSLNNVQGRSGGGDIQVQGFATIEGGTLGTLNLRVVANDVRVRYPTGMRSVVRGSLSVSGTPASPAISGDLQIQSLVFNSTFDEFIALFEAGPRIATASPFGNVRLSLNVTGNRNISISNELATAEARIDLGIKGTVDNPALTGHVETSKGKLVFQGREYDVTRGNIDFVDPVRIDPTINIQAETTVRSYQVFLSISGRMNRLLLNMRSEPPLPQLEIVNLLSGSKTTDELRQTAKASATPTGEQVFQGGAASILSDMLVSRVGSKFNLLGLDRMVRIDPYVVGAQNTTAARITLSRQLSKDLSVVYSQDLASNKQQIIQIEYFVSKNISVLASRDEENVFGLDLRIRKRF